MSQFCPTPPPYGATPGYVLAPPRPEERLGAPASAQQRPSGYSAEPVLPPPRPEDRLHFGPLLPQDRPPAPSFPGAQRQGPVAMPDRRRQELQAALSAAGITPADADLAALAEIAGLGDTTVAAVIDWLGAATRASWPRPRAV
ncbi:hypothetical protein Stsp01_21790 [Streptomyces sp. NBRC 13847]|uniref:hypothetical protein n=1 Tax=Streptomyces TaxID=1883 RepID=UPI0024A31FAA|nr:hypothetical protein [Streptomyces sp. NBRC 13847]GLW15436.1 hypothetical protein Stsp01_21790 [Streptomyces sp. NBRC 13847]